MQNIHNFFQYVINYLRSEVKYPEKFCRSQLQLAVRGRNYYSGLKRARINLRREMDVKGRSGREENQIGLCGKNRKQFH